MPALLKCLEGQCPRKRKGANTSRLWRNGQQKLLQPTKRNKKSQTAKRRWDYAQSVQSSKKNVSNRTRLPSPSLNRHSSDASMVSQVKQNQMLRRAGL